MKIMMIISYLIGVVTRLFVVIYELLTDCLEMNWYSRYNICLTLADLIGCLVRFVRKDRWCRPINEKVYWRGTSSTVT